MRLACHMIQNPDLDFFISASLVVTENTSALLVAQASDSAFSDLHSARLHDMAALPNSALFQRFH